jgi:DNA adenine methylase
MKHRHDNHLLKPIIKWVGGKSQIIEKILEKFPKRINNYHEGFLGGSSVLIGLLCMIRQNKIRLDGKIYAYDINSALIHLFKNIQNNHDELYEHTQELVQKYNTCSTTSEKDNVTTSTNSINKRKPTSLQEAMSCQESFYYWTRKCYNTLSEEDKHSVYGSALFLFLNKTCFRGLYRVSSSNCFNVSFGHYRNPEIINKKHLDELHDLLRPVEFYVCHFRSSLQNNTFCDDDFVYIDPPYIPIPNAQTRSFVSYSKDGFNEKDHTDLFNICHDLSKKKVKLMMSNSDVPAIHENFNTPCYHVTSILCKRQINSKNPESKVNEVIITNY